MTASKNVLYLQVIDLIKAVTDEIKAIELTRVGILETRTAMETKFYSGISIADVVAPTGNALDGVHDAYVSMTAFGESTSHHRAVFDNACECFIRKTKVDDIMPGGTDLALVYKEGQTHFLIVGCAAIHGDAVVRYATS